MKECVKEPINTNVLMLFLENRGIFRTLQKERVKEPISDNVLRLFLENRGSSENYPIG